MFCRVAPDAIVKSNTVPESTAAAAAATITISRVIRIR